MITLYQFPPVWGLPSASPFCLKLETYLRMARIPFEIKVVGNPARAPKGKLPFIEDRGQRVGDSNLILEYLKTVYGDPLDNHLSPLERAAGWGMRRLIDENLYWCVLYSRWIDDKGWPTLKEDFFGSLPPLVRKIVPGIVRRRLRAQLLGHGMGRHNRGEVYKIGMTDLTALSDFLGDKPYFLGHKPTTLDATAYGMLANILWAPVKSPLKEWTQKQNNLVRFCMRVRDRHFLNLEDKQLTLGLAEPDYVPMKSGTGT